MNDFQRLEREILARLNRLNLRPILDQVVEIGERLTQQVVEKLARIEPRLANLEEGQCQLLQEKAARASEDGPLPPDKFRLGGLIYEPIPRYGWLLLECLWGREDIEIEVAKDHVYGTNNDKEDSTFFNVYKHLNVRLRELTCPARVSRKSGYLRLRTMKTT